MREDAEIGTSKPRRLSFRVVLSLALTGLVTLGMATTGFLAFQSGQRSASEMARLLRAEYSGRIEASVSQLLSVPGEVNELNQAAIARGDLDLADFARLEVHFRDQIRVFKNLGWICFANTRNAGGLTLHDPWGTAITLKN